MPKEEIYVRLPNWVGDVVMAEPFLRALRQARPEARISLHGKAFTFPFLRANGLHDLELPLQRRGGPLWPFLEGRRLARTAPRFDLAFLLPNTLSSALIPWVAGARVRIGYSLSGRSLLLSRALKAAKVGRLRPTPMVDYYLQLAAAAGIEVSAALRRPVLEASPESERAVESFFETIPRSEVWALNFGGAWATKRYPSDQAAELIRLIAARGHSVLLLGGPDERELGRSIVEKSSGLKVWGLPEHVFPLDQLAALMKRCRILISTDSGPRHFGVAAGTPTLALIGPTHPGYTGVDFAAGATLCLELPCWPCHKARCPRPGAQELECLRSMSAAQVLAAAEALLSSVDESVASRKNGLEP